MPAFLRSPRWVAGHVVVLVAVVLFANLGLWQLRRLDERRAYNALLTERMAEPPVPLTSLLGEDPDEVAYRRVLVTGTYRTADEVLLSTRSQQGRPGHHLLTPLATDGTVVVVDRGWVPLDRDDPPVADAAPPSGDVTVAGVLFPGMDARRSGALDGGGGRLQFVSDVDLAVLAEATGSPLHPLWVLAQDQRPAQAGPLPVVADLPELTEGSHASYAGQWFLFALVVLVGYPLLLRRVHRDEGDAAVADVPPVRRDPPVGVG